MGSSTGESRACNCVVVYRDLVVIERAESVLTGQVNLP